MKREGEVYNDMNDQSENSALPPHTAVVSVVGTSARLRCTPRQTGATSGHYSIHTQVSICPYLLSLRHYFFTDAPISKTFHEILHASPNQTLPPALDM